MAAPTRLEFSSGASRKFWQVAVAGPVLTVTYGRLGSDGQTQVRTLASAAAARQEAAKLIAGKRAKGYAPAVRPARSRPKRQARRVARRARPACSRR